MTKNLLKLHKIGLKLKAFDLKQLTLISNRLRTNFLTMNFNCIGPISLPTKKRIYCVLRSPHVNKNAREHFEIRTYAKLLEFYIPYFINIKFFIPSGLHISLLEKIN